MMKTHVLHRTFTDCKVISFHVEDPKTNGPRDGWLTMRAKTLLTKEPETILWLDRMTTDDVLWDIGACIGSYSIYPAVRHGVRVCAFEPAYYNYSVLQNNIFLNKVQDLVTAYPVGIGNKYKYDYLVNHTNVQAGSGTNSIESCDIAKFRSTYRRTGCVMDSINNLVRKGLPYPTHIKIDVDGSEPDIIDGALKVLPNIKSVLVELMPEPVDKTSTYNNTAEKQKEVIKKIESLGMILDEELYEISAKRHDRGRFKGQRNYIFYGEDYADAI